MTAGSLISLSSMANCCMASSRTAASPGWLTLLLLLLLLPVAQSIHSLRSVVEISMHCGYVS